MIEMRTAYCGQDGVIYIGKRRGNGSFYLGRGPADKLQRAVQKTAVAKPIALPGDADIRHVPEIRAAQTYLEALDAAHAYSLRLQAALKEGRHVALPMQEKVA